MIGKLGLKADKNPILENENRNVDDELHALGFIGKDDITIKEKLHCIGITNDPTYLQNSLANVLMRLQEEKDGNLPSPKVLEEC